MKKPLTLATVRAELRAVGIVLRKLDGEYQVRFAGQRGDAASYYTSDIEDARDTGLAMAARHAANMAPFSADGAVRVA